MAIKPQKIGRSSSIHDANVSIPESITQELFSRIDALPACRKASYLKSVVRSKFVSQETDSAEVRRQRAIEKWLAVESNNEATNARLLTMCGDTQILPHVTWRRFLAHAQGLVAEMLGETVPEEALLGSFSGGASTSRKRTMSHPARKYLGRADITPAALDHFCLAMEMMPGWASYDALLSIDEVPGNHLFTVPKNTTIDRVAAKEPDLNMFLQKGAGLVIRRALRKKGINLNDQSINKNLARVGSLSGDLATLDLSSASDSVTSSLVELFMPTLWWSFLCGLRSPVTIIDGVEHVNEMFSSMGNGFTFELESLLFYVITKTTAYLTGTRGVISVYGDDIICPNMLASDLTEVLGVLGFSVNTEKSFSTGSFRESCGGHYDNGYDITPFYIRKPISKLTDLIHVANAIRKWSEVETLGVLDPSTEDLWSWLASFVPRCFWGGRDTSSITQLVTPGDACVRLDAVQKPQKIDERGKLIHWLNTTWVRDKRPDDGLLHLLGPNSRGLLRKALRKKSSWMVGDDHVVTSEVVDVGTRYRRRPCSPSQVRELRSRSFTPYNSEV